MLLNMINYYCISNLSYIEGYLQMKKLKKLIATLLSFVMLCHVMPTQVYATVG